jgi:predicted phosphodiesterase
MRIAVTSDLHYDPRGYLTPPEKIRELARRIAAEVPDAVILAGDLAHGLASFGRCLDCFDNIVAPIGVIAGNHDIWFDRETSMGSNTLWEEALPRTTRDRGAVWLEHDILRVGGVAIVGSMAWYDYSAIDPGVQADPEVIARVKRQFNNDALWIDWNRDDRDVAHALGQSMLMRLRTACNDDSVRSVVVVTHVPILEEQMERRPHDRKWGFTNAYFGNLTLGRAVVREPKVRAVVSGHTHHAKNATRERTGAPPVGVCVVGSDYGSPDYVMVKVGGS